MLSASTQIKYELTNKNFETYLKISCHYFLFRYFETCYFLTTDMLAIERAERVKSIGNCKTPEEGGQLVLLIIIVFPSRFFFLS